MLIPSGIRQPKDQEIQTKEVSPGVYVGTNAYEGTYEYFEGRPVASVVNETGNHDTGMPTRTELEVRVR